MSPAALLRVPLLLFPPPPSEPHVLAAYPSKRFVSVLKRINPPAAFDGRERVLPDGIFSTLPLIKTLLAMLIPPRTTRDPFESVAS